MFEVHCDNYIENRFPPPPPQPHQARRLSASQTQKYPKVFGFATEVVEFLSNIIAQEAASIEDPTAKALAQSLTFDGDLAQTIAYGLLSANDPISKKIVSQIVGDEEITGYFLYEENVRAAIQSVILNRARKIDLSRSGQTGKKRANADVSITMPTQAGKTIVAIIVALLDQAVSAFLGEEPAQTFLITSRLKTIQKETQPEAESIGAIFKHFRFANAASNFAPHLTANHVIARTRRSEALDIIKGIRTYSLSEKIHLIVDEADEGTAKGGTLDSWLREFDKHNIEVTYTAISATPYEYHDNTPIKVQMKAGKGYAGSYEGIPIPTVSFSEFAELANIPALAGYVRPSPPTSGKRNVAQDGMVELIRSAIVAMMNGIFSPEHNLNGKKMNGGEHMAVRAYNNNAHNRELRKLIIADGFAEANDVVVLLADSTSEDMSKITLTQFIENAERRFPGKSLVLLFSSGARRGVRFPARVTIFMDFTNGSTTDVTWEQGFKGRASGYGKVTPERSTFVIVTDTYFGRISECLANEAAYTALRSNNSGRHTRNRIQKRDKFAPSFTTVSSTNDHYANISMATLFETDPDIALEIHDTVISKCKPFLVNSGVKGIFRFRGEKDLSSVLEKHHVTALNALIADMGVDGEVLLSGENETGHTLADCTPANVERSNRGSKFKSNSKLILGDNDAHVRYYYAINAPMPLNRHRMNPQFVLFHEERADPSHRWTLIALDLPLKMRSINQKKKAFFRLNRAEGLEKRFKGISPTSESLYNDHPLVAAPARKAAKSSKAAKSRKAAKAAKSTKFGKSGKVGKSAKAGKSVRKPKRRATA